MNKTSRYNYDGSTIILTYNDHAKDTSKFNYSSVGLLFNGEMLSPIASWEGIGDQHCLKYELPNQKLCIVDLHGNGLIHGHSVSIDGVNLIEKQRDVESITRSIDHLRTLAQYPPIARLGAIDFLSLKALTKGVIASCPSAQLREPRYFLKISDKEFDDKAWASIRLPSSKDFIEIESSDIKPGDDILIVENKLAFQQMRLIENVSFTSFDKFVPHVPPDYLIEGVDQRPRYIAIIEGSNVTWTTHDVKEHHGLFVEIMMRDAGLVPDDLIAIFSPDLTIDEFSTMRVIHQSGLEITDEMLQRLANGENAHELIKEIQNQAHETDIVNNRER